MIVVAIASDPISKTETAGRLAEAIAAQAAGAGSTVQYVGRVPTDVRGDGLVLRLSRVRIAHAAVLRDGPASASGGLDAADLDLALRYLAGFRVLVLVGPTPPDVVAIAGEASRFSGASLVLAATGSSPGDATFPADATVIETASVDREGGLASLVAAYAVAIDGGADPRDAWRDVAGRLALEPTTDPG